MIFGMTNQPLTVASYNIRKAIGLDRRRRPERILDVLAELDADVIALQEADRRFGERISALPFSLIDDHGAYKAVPVAIRPHSIGWHGNALLVKQHVEILDCAALHLPSIEPRGAVIADLRVGKTKLRVVGLHLDLSGLWRRRQSAAILHHLAAQHDRMPSVIMGDTNEWRPANGCLRDFGAHHVAAPTGPSYHARMPVGALDRIFVSPELSIVDAGVHASPKSRLASDHLPIWAKLKG
jgi:endonuclease/exonuclease/phosphatase family metal-dependent hydrolase